MSPEGSADYVWKVAEDSLYIIENVFTTIWVVEFFLRVRAHKLSGYFGDKSNLLDFFLAALSVLDVWVLTFIDFIRGQSSGGAPKFLSVLRLLRLLRLARLIRLVKIFKELWLVVKGMYESFKVAESGRAARPSGAAS